MYVAFILLYWDTSFSQLPICCHNSARPLMIKTHCKYPHSPYTLMLASLNPPNHSKASSSTLHIFLSAPPCPDRHASPVLLPSLFTRTVPASPTLRSSPWTLRSVTRTPVTSSWSVAIRHCQHGDRHHTDAIPSLHHCSFIISLAPYNPYLEDVEENRTSDKCICMCKIDAVHLKEIT